MTCKFIVFFSGTWDIIEVPAYLNVYDGNHTETDITFYITIRRKTLFYTVNLLLPTMLISTVTYCFDFPPCAYAI